MIIKGAVTRHIDTQVKNIHWRRYYFHVWVSIDIRNTWRHRTIKWYIIKFLGIKKHVVYMSPVINRIKINLELVTFLNIIDIRDCERFIQSDLLKSNVSNEVKEGLIHLAWIVIGPTGIYVSVLIRQWSENEHSETSTLFISPSEQKISNQEHLISVWEWTPADLRIKV